MHAIIANQIGRVHNAAQHPELAKIRPVYAFIPEVFFEESGFQKSRYLTSRWPSINCAANPHAIGSHLLPDPISPANIRSRCPVLREFLTRLEIIAAVKANPSAA